MNHKVHIATWLLCTLIACSSPTEEPPLFEQRSNSGIEFTNQLTTTTDLNILNYLYFYNGAGTAVLDVNNDGWQDVYLVSNQGADKLYLNQGDWKFKDITTAAGINNADGWTTGVTIADINGDGLMDIYLSKVSGHLRLAGHNLLYINQSTPDGKIAFQEASEEYGLDVATLGTQAAFFDYDLDGDLDAYLMNHTVYPNQKFGKGSLRYKRDTVLGDKLMQNQNGKFVEVSEQAGILSNNISFGLGLAISDLNADGYPDIYVGNDFFENDYLYINQKDGTFEEINAEGNALGHTTHFSMGNTASDINNDGRPDLISMDMLPEDLSTLKSAGTEYNYPIFQNQLRNGYTPQFMQNTLHLNRGNQKFQETAFYHQMAATEWSWAPLAADFNNDGFKDLYITNGIPGATNDLDFVNFIANENIQRRLAAGMQDEDLAFIKELPEKKTVNYFFENQQGKKFTDRTGAWSAQEATFSSGASYADFDNDGDLDLIVNNINQPVQLLENHTRATDSTASHFIKITLQGSASNTFGYGAKVWLYTDGNTQYLENYPTQGYLSSQSAVLFAGLGVGDRLDSLRVQWPLGATQLLTELDVNRQLTLKESDASQSALSESQESTAIFEQVPPLIDFTHQDGVSLEFSRDPLVPYATTNLGPVFVRGDLNNDGLDDIVALGAKGQNSELWIQDPAGTMQKIKLPDARQTGLHEDTDAVIFDANNDGLSDLLIVSGGNEVRSGTPLTPRFYLGTPEGLKRMSSQFDGFAMNASDVSIVDFDQDGDQDVMIVANVIPQQFGATPQHFMFENDGSANFKEVSQPWAPDLQTLGNIYDVQWKDLNGDGFPDAILAGHWMPLSLLIHNGKRLEKLEAPGLQQSHGWWNSLEVADFDQDGDLDIIAGNWGLNTRLQPTIEQPLRLYRNDFDGNGKIDPILTYYYQGEETTLATKDELVKQLPYINKEFLSYGEFAKATITDLFTKEKLAQADTKEVYQLASIYFENKGDLQFESHELPSEVQYSSVHDMLVDDFNKDGFLDVFLVGNNYEISTQIGRLDASYGLLLMNDKKGFFKAVFPTENSIRGACRSIEQLTTNSTEYYVIGRNNDRPLFLKMKQ